MKDTIEDKLFQYRPSDLNLNIGLFYKVGLEEAFIFSMLVDFYNYQIESNIIENGRNAYLTIEHIADVSNYRIEDISSILYKLEKNSLIDLEFDDLLIQLYYRPHDSPKENNSKVVSFHDLITSKNQKKES